MIRFLAGVLVALLMTDNTRAGSQPPIVINGVAYPATVEPGVCTQHSQSPGPAGSKLIEANVVTNDDTRMFPFGTSVGIVYTTRATSPTSLNWRIADYKGETVRIGRFNVPAGSTNTTLSCNMGKAGYFAASASLANGGGSIAAVGTQPAGIASFGILPNTGLPAPVYAFPDQHRFGLQGFNSSAAVLQRIGISWTIDDREQSWGEPHGPNTYTPNVSDIDPFYAANTWNMRLIRLDGIPGWNSRTGSFNDSYSLPKDVVEYGQYMAKVGTDTRLIHDKYYPNQRVNYYQVTWEPQVGWAFPSADFVKLYQAVYPNLHSTDPKAFVMGVAGAFPDGTREYLERYGSSGLCASIDGVVTHGYYDAGTSPVHPPERKDSDPDPAVRANALDNQMHNLRAAMQTCKPNMRLWQSEAGISYDIGIKYHTAAIDTNQLYAHGVLGARMNIILLGEGAQVTFFFFGPDYPGEVGYGAFFSLDFPDGSPASRNVAPKPEAMVLAALTRILDGTNTLGKLNNLPPHVFGYAFQQLPAGKVITALWMHDNAVWTGNGKYSQTASMPYSLTVDAAGTSGNVTVLDVMGNPSTMAYTNGKVTLALTASPVYVVSDNEAVAKAGVTAPVGYMGQ
jgi:hypothetical protein